MSGRKAFLKFISGRKYRGSGTNKLLSEKIERVFKRSFVLLEDVSSITNRITVPYVIVGGHAVVYHGHPRTTQDIDIITAPGNAEQVINDLGAEVQGPLGVNIPSLRGYQTVVGGVEVDIMELDERWTDDMLSAAVKTRFGSMVSAEFLILLKILGKRGIQDDTDVMRVLKTLDRKRVKIVRKLLSKYLPHEVEDFDSMVEIAASVDI